MEPAWIDTHVHLDRYQGAERDAMVALAKVAGVAIVAVAGDLASSRVVAGLE
ncbi:MAG: TatD family deoxyribonuclease, partial [Chloroflexi bacterium]|nr:TatD family deoxyribonuclease [Chloroflexota bacterium]